MDRSQTPMGDGVDWGDMSMFNTSQFDDSMAADSPYGNTAFHDFTNLDSYAESPVGLTLRTPSKSGPDAAASASAQDGPSMAIFASTESSSQDSSSDSSSRRKRKTNESESPLSDPVTEIAHKDAQTKQEDVKMSMGDIQQMRSYENAFSQPMHNLTLEQSLSRGDSNMSQFDFNSAASSPIQAGDFNSAMSLDAHVNMPASTVAARFNQDSPVQTINPGMFTMADSRDQSPATTNMMFNNASPNNIFSTPSSDSAQDAYGANQAWNASLQNPTWPGDFPNQLTSPGGVAFTPSPTANAGTPSATSRGAAARLGRSPLHIAPISTKSRVETQINVVMTLEKPPPQIEHLHLPLHTIAKSKLLAKEEYDKSKVLELHTMLVCSSAMHNPQFKEKALQRAAASNNEEIQRRAELARETSDEEKNDPKNVDEADKPANGGEVRICSNCIQRERKRAGRKKTKREEEQQHWERFETERVVVFNSNEYLSFKPCEPGQQPQRDGVDGEQYIPPEGSMHVNAAMRIACYCRHQSEKEGFQVIFTMKDQRGNVIAQQMSDSILITDDHKTHPQSFSTAMSGDGFYQNQSYLPNGLPMSHSMVDMTAHVQPFQSSRSAGNLQQLAYTQQFNPHSHVHQLPGSGYTSGTTSATMTPTSLSRPGSPSNAGQAGPNKKRKSSSFHRKVPSGLTMTPRVDTSQPPSSNMPSAMSMNSQFSPTNQGFANQMNQSYMTIPNNNGPAQYFGSGPPTPSEGGPFNFSQPQVDLSQMPSNQAYFSHPSSAVPSRASSPVLQQTRANMAAYARQQPIQTPTNSINARPAMFPGQVAPGSSGNDSAHGPLPMITRITPNEGPSTGGNEVAIFGENFVVGITVGFGDHVAVTQYISANSLVVIAPPGRVGSIHLNLRRPGTQEHYPDPPKKPVYTYVQHNEEMMVMALKYLSEQQYGNLDAWQNLAQSSATSFVQSRVNRAGLQHQYSGGHRMAARQRAFQDMRSGKRGALQRRQGSKGAEDGTSSLVLPSARALGEHRHEASRLISESNAGGQYHDGWTQVLGNTIQYASCPSAGDLPPTEGRHSEPPSHGNHGVPPEPSWNVASAASSDSDLHCSGSESPDATSRRPSTRTSDVDEVPDMSSDSSAASPCAAMDAWRDALATPTPPSHEAVTKNASGFPLEPAPEYRALGSPVFGEAAPRSSLRNTAPRQPPWSKCSLLTPLRAPGCAPGVKSESDRSSRPDGRALRKRVAAAASCSRAAFGEKPRSLAHVDGAAVVHPWLWMSGVFEAAAIVARAVLSTPPPTTTTSEPYRASPQLLAPPV